MFVAVKTYATVAALRPLRALLSPATPVVSLQNGASAVGQVEAALGPRPAIALAPTTEAATLVRPGLTRRTAVGRTRMGWAAGRAGDDRVLAELAAFLTAAGLATSVARPIEPDVWAKLVVNAAINPVTALAHVPNGALLERPELLERAERAAREAAAVAEALGIALPFADAAEAVADVARETAANRSSMLADLEHGRPTEIEDITGVIVRRARECDVDVPQNAALLDEVRARTKA